MVPMPPVSVGQLWLPDEEGDGSIGVVFERYDVRDEATGARFTFFAERGLGEEAAWAALEAQPSVLMTKLLEAARLHIRSTQGALQCLTHLARLIDNAPAPADLKADARKMAMGAAQGLESGARLLALMDEVLAPVGEGGGG
jgi:hypothetical protein